MAKATYTKPTSQLEYERVTDKDYTPDSVLVKGTDPDKSDNGYIGVDPIYQNYANSTEAPLQTSAKSAEGKLIAAELADDVDFKKGATPEGESDVEDSDKEEGSTPSTETETKTQTTTTSGAASTPPPTSKPAGS
jgi:hypothetical protein